MRQLSCLSQFQCASSNRAIFLPISNSMNIILLNVSEATRNKTFLCAICKASVALHCVLAQSFPTCLGPCNLNVSVRWVNLITVQTGVIPCLVKRMDGKITFLVHFASPSFHQARGCPRLWTDEISSSLSEASSFSEVYYSTTKGLIDFDCFFTACILARKYYEHVSLLHLYQLWPSMVGGFTGLGQLSMSAQWQWITHSCQTCALPTASNRLTVLLCTTGRLHGGWKCHGINWLEGTGDLVSLAVAWPLW